MKYLLTVAMLGYCFSIHGQNDLFIYTGINTSNVIHTRDKQQILYNHTLNSPLWNYGFQFGISKTFFISNRIKSDLGLKFQLRGDKHSALEIFPERKLHSIRFFYLLLPANFKYKLLHNNDIYFKFGFSPDLLLIQNQLDGDINYFPDIDTFKEKIGITGQIGFQFPIRNNVRFDILYSQSLTNIIKFTMSNEQQRGYKNQAFEANIILKI